MLVKQAPAKRDELLGLVLRLLACVCSPTPGFGLLLPRTIARSIQSAVPSIDAELDVYGGVADRLRAFQFYKGCCLLNLVYSS